MKTPLTRKQTPEEKELDRKRSELAALEIDLVQRELDLATLQAELHVFEARYLRVVGVRYAELDDIEAQIAEALARLKPKDRKAREEATQARTKAQESAESTEAIREKEEPETKFTPSESLKKLYREVAKIIHPDLATDEKDRARRTKLMAEANQAYKEGDEARLQAILDEWQSSPESVKGDGPGAELVRIIRKTSQVEERLRIIKLAIVQLNDSDLYQLKTDVDAAEKDSRNLLAEMAADLHEQIIEARKRLAQINRRKVRQ
jgi:DnaJ-domain-containing protein 1